MLDSVAAVANTYFQQGKFKEAEKLEIHVLEIRRWVLGKERSSTLDSIAALAVTISRGLGRWEEAETLKLKVVEIRKKIKGLENANILLSMKDLANTYTYRLRPKDLQR